MPLNLLAPHILINCGSYLCMQSTYVKFYSSLGDFDVEEDDAPQADFKPPPVIPKEENRTGCNKKTYFVSNERELLQTHRS